MGSIIYSLICFAWMTVQGYFSFVRPVNPLIQRYLFLTVSLLVVYYPFKPRAKPGASATGEKPYHRVVTLVMFALTLALGLYFMVNAPRIIDRWQFVDDVYWIDAVAAIVLIVLLLESSTRLTGLTLTVFTVAVLAYGFCGRVFPGIFQHGGISLLENAEIQLMSTIGTFGIAAGVCVEYIFYFVLFGAVYEAIGGGELLTKLGMLVTRKQIGGPAKSAVVASALMGTVSGSAVANVTATGTFTIPLMKKAGFAPHVAGAIEAAASTGGQFMPPIMGAGAFILAETLGIPYLSVVKAAALPAVCFYAALFSFVHFYSKRQGVGRTAIDVDFRRDILSRLHLLIPLVVLIYMIVRGMSVGYAAVRAIGMAIIVSLLSKSTRPTLRGLLKSIEKGMVQSAAVGIPIFVSGIIIGVAIHSGIAMKSTSLIVQLGKGSLFPSLVLTVLVCIVLGMGLPTSAAYVVASLFAAAPMVKNGVLPIAAHLFVFYYAIIAQITPPVAMTAYAGAGIAGSHPIKTGWMAFSISLVAFLVPFTFVANPALLMQGPTMKILYSFATTLAGSSLLAMSLAGYGRAEIRLINRALLMAAAVLLISPSVLTDLVGLAIGVGVLAYEYFLNVSRTPSATAGGLDKGGA